MLEKFERYPLTFGPTPIEKLEPAVGASRRRGRDLCQARGLQLGPRVRRQQDPQARVHHPRRARVQCRHARDDRRRAVEPYAPGRGGRGEARHEVPAGAGELGALPGCRLRPRRQHPDEPRAWAPRSSWSTKASTSASARAGSALWRTSEPRAGSPMRFRPAPRCTSSAGSASSASPRRCARRSRSSASGSTTSSSAP